MKPNTPTYSTWKAMVARCNNPKGWSFAEYGAKGVTVCVRWLQFAAFLEDMGERPTGTSIDRIDGSKGYEPGNCRWATRSEQNLNRRKYVIVNKSPRKPGVRLGRPPIGDAAETERLEIRVSKDRKATYDDAAARKGLKTGTWAKRVLDRASKR